MTDSQAAKKANRLAQEKSPYLLQHAYNPVDWFAWGEEAFVKAKSENKPILLSIGYSTCHWCHVMERESFEDHDLAAFLNQNFVSIKVDREERPDVDQIYMQALHATGQHGGWPLNMFLTPDLKPFTGGTYFPPRPMHNRPSFLQVLQTVDNIWRTEPARLQESADSITDFLKNNGATENPPGELTEEVFVNAQKQLESSYDEYRGGFVSNGPNKFPPSLNLLFLLRRFEDTGNSRLLEIVQNTCSAMRRGGIYDQIGGGLSRYATDHDWLVPHFEKMLYDNALFALALIETYRLTADTGRREEYKAAALDIFEYMRRDMTSPEGAFYSAEDADSEGEEGKFYVWTSTEIDEVLKSHNVSIEDRKLIQKFWGITVRGNLEGHSILYEPLSESEFLKATGLEAHAWREKLKQIRSILLAHRAKRIRPLRDDKIITSWNALMIHAMARASVVFSDPLLAERAARCGEFVLSALTQDSGNGVRLLRRFREGEARFAAGLSDYASLSAAFIELYRATFDSKWILKAFDLSKSMRALFESPDGGFYDAPPSPDLIVRSAEAYDGVEPSGNSTAALVLLQLAYYGFETSTLRDLASNVFTRFADRIKNQGAAQSYMLLAFYLYVKPPAEIAIVPSKDSEMKTFMSVASVKLPPFTILAARTNNAADDSIPLLAQKLTGDKTSFYICRDLQCERPVHTAADAFALLKPS